VQLDKDEHVPVMYATTTSAVSYGPWESASLQYIGIVY
jgi:hypothetical protein